MAWKERRQAQGVAPKVISTPPAPSFRRIEFVVYDDRPLTRKVSFIEAVGTYKPAPNEAPGTPKGGPGVLVSPLDGVAAVW